MPRILREPAAPAQGRVMIDDTAPYEFTAPPVRPIGTEAEESPLAIVSLAILGLAFFGGGVFWALSGRPEPHPGILTPVLVGWLAGVAGAGGGDVGPFAVAHLRAAAARYPHDRVTQDLVRELLRHSPEFAALWPVAELSDQRHLLKTVEHAELGPIPLTCDILVVPERDQHVVLFTAEPGTPAWDALRLLSVIGLQQLS